MDLYAIAQEVNFVVEMNERAQTMLAFHFLLVLLLLLL